MRILYHAINGTGLGHLMRLTAIAKHVEREAPWMHQMVVTSGKYQQHLDRVGLPTLILPIDESSPFGGVDKRRATVASAIAADLLAAAVSSYAPALVVFDTHVSPAVVERLRAASRPFVTVLRKTRAEYLARFLDSPAALDAAQILVPHARDEFCEGLPNELTAKLDPLPVTYVGTIVFPAPRDEATRHAVRARLRLSPDAPLIVLTAGSGGYGDANAHFIECASAAAARVMPGAQIVRVCGPYARDLKDIPGVLTVASEPEMPALFSMADAVFGHGGYNTVHELLNVGARAVLTSMPRKNESQEERVRKLELRFAALTHEAGVEDYVKALTRVLQGPKPEPLVFDGALRAAKTVIASTPVMPRARVSWDKLGASMIPEEALLEVDLGEGSVETLEERAQRSIAALATTGVAPENTTLTFIAARGGATLADLAERLRERRFSALVARVPECHLTDTSAVRFAAFERCRALSLRFRVDITPLETPATSVDYVPRRR